MAIRLLSNQVLSQTPTQVTPTPTLIRALSSAVWVEQREHSEEVFK